MATRARRRTDALSRELIVDTATQLLDSGGEEALTLRALTIHLSTGYGALYHHVRNKDDLLAAATDDVIARAMTSVTSAATRNATHDAAGAAGHDATGGVTRDATGAAGHDATGAAGHDATGSATHDATGAAGHDATGSATHDATGAAGDDATGSVTRGAIGGVALDAAQVHATAGNAPPGGVPPGDTLRAIAMSLFDAITEHPWVGAQLGREPSQPALLDIYESVGAQLEALGVPETALFDAAGALVNYILGVAGQTAANARLREDDLAAVADQWAKLDPARYPRLHRAAARLTEHDDRAQFLAGVGIFLAGIEAQRHTDHDADQKVASAIRR